ncbi:MAG: hypothetical protein A2Y64_08220 [Candidatus Coatesbacteria bacterium RBG_13_66_14]|uniref:Outer membrane protein beta-barrel domain-containing protein n=1 Tax=Candidatus Coatesbacteria bacterium RBG_13_66_14 TaxID=1817816 RepID=A0A1F5EX88_9BACT|nr:MAG: hypothetical protein A2Y64_08220 [Candidatus Coatesbacteria bacterium RBG_13_66_14]
MRNPAPLLLLALALCASAADTEVRLALYADTMLAVGDWAALPGDPGRTMFGPSPGAEIEITLRLGRSLWGLAVKYGTYGTGGYVGTGEWPNRVEEAEAHSISALGFAGVRMDEGGTVGFWCCLGLGVEWLRASETVGGRDYDYGRVFQPCPCACLAIGADFFLTEDLYIPVKASYDVSFGQVLGYGGYSGEGTDLVLSAGLGVVF